MAIVSQITQAEVVFVNEVDKGYSLIVKLLEYGISHQLSITTKLYQEPKKQGEKGTYVDDTELAEKVDKQLEELGISATFDTISSLMGQVINVHYAADLSIVSIYPITSFTSFEYLDNQLSAHLQDMIDDGLARDLDTTEFSDFPAKRRFNFGVVVENDKGKKVNVRLANIEIRNPDKDADQNIFLSLKYTSKEIEGYETILENDKDLPQSARASIKEVIKTLTEKRRNQVIRDFKNHLGIDIEKAIEEGTTFVIPQIRISSIGTNSYATGFIKDLELFKALNNLE